MIGKLTRAAYNTARPVVAEVSQALADGMEERVFGEFGELHIPHYWAVYVHDGYNGFGPRYKKFLVWFANPEDDPRLAGGPAVRYTDTKFLRDVWPREEWLAAIDENRRRRLLGMPPFMFITKFKRGQPPRRFFAEGLTRFEENEAPRIVAAEFDKFVRGVGQAESETKTATFRLRGKP